MRLLQRATESRHPQYCLSRLFETSEALTDRRPWFWRCWKSYNGWCLDSRKPVTRIPPTISWFSEKWVRIQESVIVNVQRRGPIFHLNHDSGRKGTKKWKEKSLKRLKVGGWCFFLLDWGLYNEGLMMDKYYPLPKWKESTRERVFWDGLFFVNLKVNDG